MKISSDKRVKESSDSFYGYRVDTNFQIAVALACLRRDEFDMHTHAYGVSCLGTKL